MNLMKHRAWYFAFSALIIAGGIVALIVFGLPLAIDFTGGTKLELQFPQADALSTSATGDVLREFGFDDNIIQIAEANTLIIRTKTMDDVTQAQVEDALAAVFGGEVVVLRAESVGPSVSTEVAGRAVLAVAIASIGILAYIWWAFRGVPHALRYGVSALIAMLHDVVVVLGFMAIMGALFGWEVDALFLTAVLTVIGYSVHDSIVVFDRIRENRLLYRRADYENVVNHSVVQTLDRSINTQLSTAFTLLALVLFGGDSIREFVMVLLVGVVSGTYSSIFNASPLLIVWEKQEWRNLFGGGNGGKRKQATAASN